MDRRSFLAGSTAGFLTLATETLGQETIVLRFHTLVSLQTSILVDVIEPWARRIEAGSGGRVKIEFYGNMSLGGAPQSLYDQVKDGVVDFSQSAIGYTPGRFPKSETFELPFLMTNGEQTSAALHRFVQENSLEEFAGTKLICANAHGPGLIHVKRPVEKMEDLKGLKIRGGSRIVNDMLSRLGAEPITIPITQLGESIASGVIDGTTLPWDITLAFRTSELLHHHVEVGGQHGLYTQVLFLAMNEASYTKLPQDIQALFDAEPGVELARASGEVTDRHDVIARKVAQDMGNSIVTLDEAETARWKEAVQPAVETWYAESEARGIDGRALHQRAMELVAEESARA
jgi:TRAP-type C4-dicarboxylate transport system substrate-binding protein